jgi:DNA-binding transcriptional regulator GbsR (MarR family)
LFQTGYLTVKKKERGETGVRYIIDFPNFEVRDAFLSRLMAAYARKRQEEVERVRDKVYEGLKEKDEKKLERSLTELFANISYKLITERESYYHSLFLLAAKMSGYEVESEVDMDKRRIDAVLKKGREVIVVEIKHGKGKKVEELLKEGMEQIKERKYCEKYDSSEVSLLAVAFGEDKEIGCKFE